MNETVTITISRFAELIRKEERIELLAKLFDSNSYVSSEDVQVVLGIERKEKASE
jgi:hypothetical protein